MRNSYIVKQSKGIITLTIFAFVAHYYVLHIYHQIHNNLLQQAIMIIAISILLLVTNHMIYNYAKRHPKTFMKHKIWNKLFIFLLIGLVVSFVLFIVFFVTTSL